MIDRDKLNKLFIRESAKLETRFDRAWKPLRRRLRLDQPAHIAAYRGYGNDKILLVEGRVLANRPRGGPDERDKAIDNLRHSFQRWNSREIADIDVTLTFADQQQVVRTDEEGYYRAQFDMTAPRSRNVSWEKVDATVMRDGKRITASHEVMVPGSRCEFLVISDLDDTVIETGITNLLTAARLTFLENARTRQPLPGVGALYAALQHGNRHERVNPVCYVSSSPWNLYDLLRDFLEINRIPKGPLFLRDLGVDDTRFIKRRGHLHKLENVLRIIAMYPDKQAILIGDSGQEDAHLYAEAVRQHPDRFLSIYIRDVDPGIDSALDEGVARAAAIAAEYGVELIASDNSVTFAEHAAQLGMLRWDQLPAIVAADKVDRNRNTLAEETPI